MARGILHWRELCLFQLAYSVERIADSKKLNAKRYPLNAKKGSILIVILWALFFLSMLAVAVNAYIWPSLSLAGKLKDRAKMYYLAKAGVKRAILEIVKNDATDSYDALKESWSNNEDGFKEIELEEGTFSVQRIAYTGQGTEEIKYGLIDEERKININKASYSVLKKFFEIAGETTSQQAADIAASIIDWRDEDDEPEENGAESGYYLTLDPPYPCKNEDFEVLEELLLVKGMSQEVFDKVKDKITIYGTGAVNINTADALVLQSLGMSQALAEKVIHFRKGSDGKEATQDDNVFESTSTIAQTLNDVEGLSGDEFSQLNSILGAGLISVRSDNFRGEAIGKLTGKETSGRIVFVFNRNKVMKYWREE
jgi:general secretion pathway protein K